MTVEVFDKVKRCYPSTLQYTAGVTTIILLVTVLDFLQNAGVLGR